MTRMLTSLAVAALLVACSNKTAPQASAAAPATAKAAAAANTSAPAPAAVNAVSGKVLETLNGGSYTYLKLQTANGEVWAAVPKADIKVGSEATVYGQMTMQNWESETLKRKFDAVIFATLTPPPAAGDSSAMGGMMGGHGSQGQPATSNDPKDHMAAPDAGPISVEKAPGGKTVAEIWASRATLGDKQVVVRGKVVKSLSGIMGKNWIHLRDGSGKHEDGSDDITVTMTGNAPKVGDVVLVTGTVRVDKDFGSGYMYPVIIEDAKIQ